MCHAKQNITREVIFQTRVRGFDRGIGRVLLFVSRCLDTTIKPEARVFEMASQSAPNCKQKKKRKQKNKRKKKSYKHVIFAFFGSISAQFVMIMSVFFTTKACLFQVATICILWRPASFGTWTG